MNFSGSPGFPNSAINRRIRASRFSLELKSWSTRSAWVRMLRSSRNFRNKSENSCSSCMTRIISSLVILSAVHLQRAVAVDRRSPGIAASADSPTKSPEESSVMVASLPECETTVSFCAAILKIKDGVCLISLGEEVLFLFQFDDSSAKTSMREKDGRVKCAAAHIGRQHSTSFEVSGLLYLNPRPGSECLKGDEPSIRPT